MADDDAFQAELLLSFYRESVEHASRLAGAVAAHQSGQIVFEEETPGGRLSRSIEQVLKDEAHALKGSSATLELSDIATAAAGLEDPAKEVIALGADAEDRSILLDAFCSDPAEELRVLLAALAGFGRHFEAWLTHKRAEGLHFAELLEPADAAALATVNGDAYAEAVLGPFAKLWGADVASLAAGAAAPVTTEGTAGAAATGGP